MIPQQIQQQQDLIKTRCFCYSYIINYFNYTICYFSFDTCKMIEVGKGFACDSNQ